MIVPLRARGVLTTVVREELWVRGAAWDLREERLSHGRADFRDGEIVASDAADDELLVIADRELARARGPATPDVAVATSRIVVSVRRAARLDAVSDVAVIFSSGAASVVSTPASAGDDARLLARVSGDTRAVPMNYRDAPIVWRNGTGAVLMHEAAGHPAEHGRRPVDWPSWLTVRDEPVLAFDDLGRRTSTADLLRGVAPATARCATFADVPLARMSNVVVCASGAPFEMPERRIEVRLVTGGAYDPLSDTIRLAVTAADFVDGDRVQRLRPFEIEESRASVAFALRGAAGGVERYPGVVCSSEGQEVFVGSHSPMLLTEF